MNIASLAKKSKSLLRKAEDIKILEKIYIGLLGKNGEINLLLKTLGKLPKKQRKDAGKALNNLKSLKDPSQIADNIASHLNLVIPEKQKLFEIFNFS